MASVAVQVGLMDDGVGAEEEATVRLWPELLAAYKGEYVAVSGGRVAGHSQDDEELAERMYAALGDQPFYIARVADEPAVYEVPSPEVVR